MQHLTPDEIERFAEGRGATDANDARSGHLAACARCRDEVELLRGLIAGIRSLERPRPARGFEDGVLQRVDLPSPALERLLAELPKWAPSADFADAVLRKTHLPHPVLDAQLASLSTWSPSPGFAASVMSRVRLPVPWPERLVRFARHRAAVLATAAASMLAITGGAAGWLFGTQGLAPGQLVSLVAGGAQTLLMDIALAVGRAGYRFGLVDLGSSIVEQISPSAALGSLALLSAAGLVSLWTMSRLFRAPVQPLVLRKAA